MIPNSIWPPNRKVIECAEDGAIVYTLPPLDDIWLDESERCEKRFEVAKESAQACDHWRFEAEKPLLPLPTCQPTDIPCHTPTGLVVLDDDYSLSSSDESTVVSDSDNTPVTVDVGPHCHRARQNEGATLGGPCRSKRLRQERNALPTYPLTGLTLGVSQLLKIPCMHALVSHFSCSLGTNNLLLWLFLQSPSLQTWTWVSLLVQGYCPRSTRFCQFGLVYPRHSNSYCKSTWTLSQHYDQLLPHWHNQRPSCSLDITTYSCGKDRGH